MPTGLLTISQYTPEPPIQVPVTSVLEVRGWYSRNFIAGDGVTPVLGNSSNGQQGPYYDIAATLNADGEVVVPAHEIQATTLSNPTANYFEGLWVDGAFVRYLLPNTQGASGWAIPTIYGDPIAYDEIATYNRAKRLLYPPNTYFTADQVIAEILRLSGNFNYMAVGVNGIGQASFPPVVASAPQVLMANDPRVGDWFNIEAYSAAAGNTAAQNATFIAAAVAAAAAAGGGIYIPLGTFSTNSVTISVPVVFAPGASILSPATGQTVTITKSIEGNPQQHFGNATAGLGTISLTGNGSVAWVYAEWWGASPSATATVNAASLNAANAALVSVTGGIGSSGDILLAGSGTYDFNATVYLGSDAAAFTGIGLAGTNAVVGTVLRWTGSTSGTAIYSTRARYPRLRDFKLINSVAAGTTIGLRLSGPSTGTNNSGAHLENVVVDAFNVGGLAGDGAAGGHDASEITVIGGSFQNNNTGFRIDGSNSLNISFYNTGIESNTTYGIDANTGNVNVYGGAFGRNGIDIKQTNSGVVVIDGIRTESKVIFDSSAVSATSSAQLIGISQSIVDDFTVSAATNANPIAITTAANHGFTTGDRVFIRNAVGNTAANGPWTIIVTGVNSFTLTGSVGNGVYSGSGVGNLDHNPIKLRTGTQATISGCLLKGSVYLNNGAGGVSVTIKDSSTIFVSPLDVSDGNGTLAYYTLDHTRRVDASGTVVTTFNETGRVSGTTLVPFVRYSGSALTLVTLLSQTEGAALTVSSNTITPTHSVHQVGAGLIKTITVPSSFSSGTIALIPTAAFTYDATGNVLGTGTAVVGRTMFATYSASTSKWSMSY